MKRVTLVTFLAATGNLASALYPDPSTLWEIPALDASDSLYAGLQQISLVKNTLIHNGSLSSRTYSHHASAEYFDGRIWIGFSSGLIDEDQNGQQAWVTSAVKGMRGEWEWGRTFVSATSALLSNQTSEANYTYWCDNLVSRLSAISFFNLIFVRSCNEPCSRTGL